MLALIIKCVLKIVKNLKDFIDNVNYELLF